MQISSEFQMLRTQLDEQKLLRKICREKSSTIGQLQNVGQQLGEKLGSSDADSLGSQLRGLAERWQQLVTCVEGRWCRLERGLPLVAHLQPRVLAMQDWLEQLASKVENTYAISASLDLPAVFQQIDGLKVNFA